MKCEAAREMIGLQSELAAADRAELEHHVASCAACAAVAADEAAMRSLLSARAVPAFAGAQRPLLMQVPPPGLAAAIWRARAATWAPVATLAVVVLVGVGALDRSRDVPPTATNSNPQIVAPTQVARVAPVRASPEGNRMTAPQPGRPPAPAVAPPADIVFVIEPAPASSVPTAPESVQPVDIGPGSGTDAGSRGSDSGGTTPPTAPVPTARAAATEVAWLDLTVQAVTDLAGGSAACPGCDGITPADGQAAAGRPVGRVSVRLWGLGQDGGRVDLGTLTLEPVSAGVAVASARVPEAAAYAIRFEAAEAGFTLCPAAEAEVIVRPGEGGLFAAFRLWTGCPAPPPLSP